MPIEDRLAKDNSGKSSKDKIFLKKKKKKKKIEFCGYNIAFSNLINVIFLHKLLDL